MNTKLRQAIDQLNVAKNHIINTYTNLKSNYTSEIADEKIADLKNEKWKQKK